MKKIKTGAVLNLITSPFMYAARIRNGHTVSKTLFMAPSLSSQELEIALNDVENQPLASTQKSARQNILKQRDENRILKIAGHKGAKRHERYAHRFPKPAKNTPFQS